MGVVQFEIVAAVSAHNQNAVLANDHAAFAAAISIGYAVRETIRSAATWNKGHIRVRCLNLVCVADYFIIFSNHKVVSCADYGVVVCGSYFNIDRMFRATTTTIANGNCHRVVYLAAKVGILIGGIKVVCVFKM